MLIMKLTAFFILVLCLNVTANGFAQRVSLSEKNVPLEKVFREIKKQTGYTFAYTKAHLEKARPVTVNIHNATIEQVLELCFRDQPLDYTLVNRTVVIINKKASAQAPEVNAPNAPPVVVQGRVLNDKGEPLPGATVTEKGSQNSTSTGEDGSFTIRVASARAKLVVSYIEHESKEVAAGNGAALTIVLTPAAASIEQVVVIGYGTQKKVTVSGAITSVQPTEVLRSPVSSVANALAGRASGIVAVQRSGEPGRDIADIFIRGVGTFAGGTSARPLILVDGVERSLADLDPHTIESFNILKDASATAVFGVRGANGVIIITTKTGVRGKPQFAFTANQAWQNPIRLPEMLNAVDYALLRNEAEANDQNNPNARKFSDEDIELFRNGTDPFFHPNVNWMDLMLKEYAPQQQYNLNMSGGTADMRYFVSLGYLNQDGAYKFGDFFKEFSANPNYKRYNIRSNFDFNVSKNFSLALKASSEIGNSNYSNSNTSDIFGTIFSANPIMSPVVYEDKIVRYVDGLTAFQISNPPLYQLLVNGYNTNFRSRLNTNISGRYKLDGLVRGLSARAMLAYDSYYLQSVSRTKRIPLWDLKRNPAAQNFQDSIIPIAVVNQYEGPVSFNGESFAKNRKLYSEAALEYTRSLGGHSLSALALGTVERLYDGSNQLPFNYMGLVGRVTYNYRNRYFTDVNMGYNGSENFAEGKQFGFFPSVSLGYAVSEESFFPKTDVLSYMKIRGSYGVVGNDKIGGKRFLFLPSSFALGNTYYFGLNHTAWTGYRENSLGNPGVTWEKANKLNAGVDFRLFKNKLTLSGDYFYEKRNDILWNLNVPVTFGSPSLIAPYNIGQAENRGFELEAGYKNSVGRNFSYWVNGNYTFARNKILYMDETPQPHPGLVQTGSRIGQPKGLLADGLFNTWEEINDQKRPKSIWEGNTLAPGDIRYVDVTGDGIIDDNDRVNIGNPNIPEVIFGTTVGFAWKGVELSAFFQGADNVSAYLTGEAAWPFIAGTKTAFENAKESWSQQRYERGDKITLPRLTASPDAAKHNYRMSSFWMQDASYVRLKNVELSYTFPQSLVSRIGMKNMRVYASGQNLHTWTKMRYFDPEIPSSNGSVYAMTRVFNIGANIQF